MVGRSKGPRFLLSQQPALTLGAVGAVVGAGAGDEEGGVGLDDHARPGLPVVNVVEVLGRVGGEGVDTLQEGGREGRGRMREG